MITKDVLWKGIVEDLFEDFLMFFFPNQLEKIDFNKKFEFLDKELEKIQPESEAKRRHADKLVKVHLKDGKEQWMLIHIEVQGYQDKDFARRMFIYYYRIYEKYQKSVSAIAIYTDKGTKYHPTKYTKEYWGTELNYTFNAYKVIEQKQSDFDDNTNNPFVIVMKTAWVALQKEKNINFLDLKINLARQLMKNGFSKEKTNKVLNFIGHYIRLQNPKEIRTFEKEIDLLTKPRQPMGIIEAIREELKRQAVEEGLEEGREQGLEEGLEQGLEQGFKQGEAKGAKKMQATTIINSIAMGLSADIIAGLLNTPISELKVLVKDLISSNLLARNQVEILLDDSKF